MTKAWDKQVGGTHYKNNDISKYLQKNKINWLEANVIKYIIRHKDKNGLEDLKKAQHYLEMLIELDYE